MTDADLAPAHAGDGVGDNSGTGVVHNELLCFVQQKSGVLAADDLVKLCLDFYKKDEVLAARQLVNAVVSKRLSPRQGPNMMKATIEDIVRCILDTSNNLPMYCAVNLKRIPAIDAKHCDITAILLELKELRAEVRETCILKSELDSLRLQVSECIALKEQVSECCALRDQIAQLQEQVLKLSHDDRRCEVPEDASRTSRASAPATKTVPLFTDLFKPTNSAGVQNVKISRPPVIGASNRQSKVKAVATKRSVDIFVSRLPPDTNEDDIRELVREIVPNIQDEEVQCTRLQSKYEQLYCSYFIAVRVDPVDMKQFIELFLNADSWPSGLLVRRYFHPKRNHGDH